ERESFVKFLEEIYEDKHSKEKKPKEKKDD
ncbi:hypothetical protein LCGC14_1280650, partial [marine sediment metagenome]